MSLRARRTVAAATLTAAVTVALVPMTSASADPSANAWASLRHCESSGNYATDTGNDHYGAYQFDVGTWRAVGGSGLPSKASKAEQDARALILYRKRGWQPWQCARILGLKEDSDARSGRISDIVVPGAKPAPAKTAAPAYPSTHTYRQGVTNSVVARWQKQMARRGAPLHGTGVFGATTTAVLSALEKQNRRAVTGVLGPRTWALAWTGKYSAKPVAAPKPKPKPVPAWPGKTFRMGDTSPALAVWQKQLRSRGLTQLHGTGVFGATTLAAVKRLQLHNGLGGSGVLGPKTWPLAWTGRL